MSGFAADLDELRRLSSILKGLADEAGKNKTDNATSPLYSRGGEGGIMTSVVEASSLTGDLIDTLLVEAIVERLSETGEIMGHVADEYKNQDDDSAQALAAQYTAATGEWNAA